MLKMLLKTFRMEVTSKIFFLLLRTFRMEVISKIFFLYYHTFEMVFSKAIKINTFPKNKIGLLDSKFSKYSPALKGFGFSMYVFS